MLKILAKKHLFESLPHLQRRYRGDWVADQCQEEADAEITQQTRQGDQAHLVQRHNRLCSPGDCKAITGEEKNECGNARDRNTSEHVIQAFEAAAK